MSAERLDVYNKTLDLLHKAYPILNNFPKSEKFALAQKIKNELMSVASYISQANEVKTLRRKFAEKAQGHLHNALVMLDFSKKRRYLSAGQLKYLRGDGEAISRMLGGYIRSTSKKGSTNQVKDR